MQSMRGSSKVNNNKCHLLRALFLLKDEIWFLPVSFPTNNALQNILQPTSSLPGLQSLTFFSFFNICDIRSILQLTIHHHLIG